MALQSKQTKLKNQLLVLQKQKHLECQSLKRSVQVLSRQSELHQEVSGVSQELSFMRLKVAKFESTVRTLKTSLQRERALVARLTEAYLEVDDRITKKSLKRLKAPWFTGKKRITAQLMKEIMGDESNLKDQACTLGANVIHPISGADLSDDASISSALPEEQLESYSPSVSSDSQTIKFLQRELYATKLQRWEFRIKQQTWLTRQYEMSFMQAWTLLCRIGALKAEAQLKEESSAVFKQRERAEKILGEEKLEELETTCCTLRQRLSDAKCESEHTITKLGEQMLRYKTLESVHDDVCAEVDVLKQVLLASDSASSSQDSKVLISKLSTQTEMIRDLRQALSESQLGATRAHLAKEGVEQQLQMRTVDLTDLRDHLEAKHLFSTYQKGQLLQLTKLSAGLEKKLERSQLAMIQASSERESCLKEVKFWRNRYAEQSHKLHEIAGERVAFFLHKCFSKFKQLALTFEAAIPDVKTSMQIGRAHV